MTSAEISALIDARIAEAESRLTRLILESRPAGTISIPERDENGLISRVVTEVIPTRDDLDQ